MIKQSAYDLTLPFFLLSYSRVTIFYVYARRNRKSLNKDSQIRDLPQLPLSNSVDAHWHGSPRVTASMQKLNLGLDVSRRATYGILSADQEIHHARQCLRLGVRSGLPPLLATVGLLVYPLRR